VKARHIVAMED